MEVFEFKNPFFLFLLIPFFVLVLIYFLRKIHNRSSAVGISSQELLERRKTIRTVLYPYLPVLRFAAVFLLIIALARPGKGVQVSSVKNLGIDIMIAFDVSGSMLGEDFQPKNRINVAKKVLRDFIEKRKADRVGMVVFAGDAYLQCPLTIEHDMILEITDEVEVGTVNVRGTAIGDAIALASSRMMESKAKSKVILLLTDGRNNTGTIDPETAASTCSEMGVKVYSVGIGKKGVPVPYPTGFFGMKRNIESDLDDETLKKISEITGGKYFNATSAGVLWQNIRDIDMLEKSEVKLNIYHEFYDKFQYLLLTAIGLFFLEIILRSVFFRKLP